MGTIKADDKPRNTFRKRERDSEVAGRPDDSVTDPRFIAAETDPCFGRVPKRAKKAVLDDRFKQKLKQNPGFRTSDTPVDRFGRLKRGRPHDPLRDAAAESEDSESDSDDDVDVDDRPMAPALHDEDSDDDDSDLEEVLGEQEAEEIENIPRGKATGRIAVIGLDWTTTRAVDIFACLDSFCPPGKSIVSVEVHPSKFGLQRLAAEAKFGPQVIAKGDMKVVEDAKKQNLVVNDLQLDISGKGQKISDDGDASELESRDDNEGSDDEEVEEKRWKEQVALRKYEEERLKYYYAIVEFDAVKAADAVYEQCDGVEYAQSGRAFDLRFVPDDMKIETTPRDSAEDVPDGYMPPNVAPSSLNNSTVKLSWDADDPERVILMKKAIGKQKLDEENLKAYLGSASEDEDEKPSAAEIEKKRNLLLGSSDDDDEEEPDLGMEISFEPGMLEKAEEIVKRKQAKDERKGETPWEARLRRLQERKAEKRRIWKQQREDMQRNDNEANDKEVDDADPTNAVDSSGFSDPFFSQERDLEREENRNKRKERKMIKKKESLGKENSNSSVSPKDARKLAELELLVMDNAASTAKDTGSIREMLAKVESDDDDGGKSRGGKRSGRKRGGRGKAEKDAAPRPSTMDTNDPRFQGLFDSHLFAMDPTHPKFKDNETTQRIVKEKMRRTKRAIGNQDREPSKTQGESKEQTNAANSELRQLAVRLKARAKVRGKQSRKR